jgi:NADPH:quinone reductase-like Zn-dependent oxidoreductase
MRAVVLSEFGPPENLLPSDVPEPSPGPDQWLIEVQVANITFVETQIRAGRAPNPAMLPQLPAILGRWHHPGETVLVEAAAGGVRVTPEQSRELSAKALAEAAAGRLRPLIGQTFPLERAAEAHAAIESRQTIGKTLLIV